MYTGGQRQDNTQQHLALPTLCRIWQCLNSQTDPVSNNNILHKSTRNKQSKSQLAALLISVKFHAHINTNNDINKIKNI